MFCTARRLIVSFENRLLGIFALCVLSLVSACSQESEQAREQATGEVASVEAHIVYYAMPG
jgi:hypothetical protein